MKRARMATGAAKVSIIIPCYNKCDYVAATIESALAQTHPSEVIVVDDGSTDASLEQIKNFEGRIKWVSGPNRGGGAARNIGLRMATGQWVQFLDADDILPPEKLAMQLAAMEGASANAMAFCPWSYFHDSGKVDPPDPRRYWRSYPDGASLLIDMWYRGGFFPPHVWLAPIDLIDRVGGWNEYLTGDDDGEFFGRLLIAATETRFCDNTRVLYRDPPAGSVSRARSLRSARSFWRAFEIVSEQLLLRRTDTVARRACLARARKTAYTWQNVPEVLDKAAAWERSNGLFDLSPALPKTTRYFVAFFGLKLGLRLRHVLSI